MKLVVCVGEVLETLVVALASVVAAMFMCIMMYEQNTAGIYMWSFAFGIITGMKLPLRLAPVALGTKWACILIILLDILPLPYYSCYVDGYV